MIWPSILRGIGTLGPIHDLPAESWRAVIDVCLTGVFLSVKHESRAMLQGNGGVIVNLASTYGRQPGEGMAAYCCAKAGVEMLTRVAALELGPRGVRVNAIAPGFVETPMTAPTQPKSRAAYVDSIPLGRPGQPDDIARAALFLVSERRGHRSTARRWLSMAEKCIVRRHDCSLGTAES